MSFCINPKCASPLNEESDMSCKSCGTDLLLEGQYRVEKLLSDETGFGKIYRVIYRNGGKILKVLAKNTDKALELFKREADILRILSHPGIPKGHLD